MSSGSKRPEIEYDDEPHSVFDNDFLEDVIDTKTWKFKKTKQSLNLLNFFKIRHGQYRTDPKHMENKEVLDTVKSIKRIFGCRDRPIPPTDQLEFLRDKNNYEDMYRQSMKIKGEEIKIMESKSNSENESCEESFYAIEGMKNVNGHTKHASLSLSPMKAKQQSSVLKKQMMLNFNKSNTNSFKGIQLKKVNQMKIQKMGDTMYKDSPRERMQQQSEQRFETQQQVEREDEKQQALTSRGKLMQLESPKKRLFKNNNNNYNNNYNNNTNSNYSSESPVKQSRGLTRVSSKKNTMILQKTSSNQSQGTSPLKAPKKQNASINLQAAQLNKSQSKFDINSPLKRHQKANSNNYGQSSFKQSYYQQQKQIQKMSPPLNNQSNIAKKTFYSKNKYWSSNDLSMSPKERVEGKDGGLPLISKNSKFNNTKYSKFQLQQFISEQNLEEIPVN